MAALSRAEDLQAKMDRIAVEETLRGVAGGAVKASVLIDCFAGTLFRESRRVKVCTGLCGGPFCAAAAVGDERDV